jgi:uncharacterized protein DUF29
MKLETDYHAWVMEQVAALRARDLDALDFDNLAEEIEDLAKAERRRRSRNSGLSA